MLKKLSSQRPIVREVVALSRIGAPVVGAQLAQFAVFTTDVLMAGRLGSEDLAAIAVGHSFLNPVVISVMGVLMSLNPIVAHLFGAERFGEIGDKMRQGLWVAAFFTLPAVLIARNTTPLMELANIDVSLQPLTDRYLEAISWGLVFNFGYMTLRFFNDGLSKTKPALVIALIAIPINAFLDYALMFGKFGAPRLGAVGAGYATSVVWLFMFAAMSLWIFSRKSYRGYGRFRISGPNWQAIREILAIGLPNGVSVSLEVGMFALAALMAGSLGVTTVASHQVAINIAAIMYMFPFGISIAVSARVGQAAGRGSLEDARLVGYIGVGLCTLVAILCSLAMLFLRFSMVRLYTDEPAVLELAAYLLIFGAMFEISDGVQSSSIGALRGLKDTRVPMLSCALSYWLLGAPLGYWLSMHGGWGAAGIWIGLIAGLTLAAVLHNWRFNALTRRPHR